MRLSDLTSLSLPRSTAATLLEFEWSPSGVPAEAIQQKRRALLQRSSHRVQEIKAKRAQAKSRAEVRGPSEAQERSKAKEARPTSCEAKTKSEPPKTKTKQKGQQTAVQTTETAHSITAGNSKLLPPGNTTLQDIFCVTLCPKYLMVSCTLTTSCYPLPAMRV